ncbi:hydrophobin family protein [Nonomuraea sp. NPDC048901]|uniref:hydrophobin family protein n=1 Tax=Nonomuraea sp. NPDC048901 TaxID=3155627 RepID=UPI0033D8C3CB
MKMPLGRLSGIVAIATLALTLPLTGTGLAQAAQTIPMACNAVQNSSDPAISTLLGLLGIVAPPNTPVGVQCRPMPNGDPSVNFCAQNNSFNGVVAFGQVPKSHTCP